MTLKEWENKFEFNMKTWNRDKIEFKIIHIKSRKEFIIDIENIDILTNVEDIISEYLTNIEKDIRDENIRELLR